MSGERFLENWDGQTTEQLLALEGEYRVDSLVLAFEQALQFKPDSDVSREERYIQAVEGLEREVNNGGYGQFFLNSSREFVGLVEDALRAVGCPRTAGITRDAIAALGLGSEVSPDRAEAVVLAEDPRVTAALEACDDRYYSNDEDIAARLFEWIKVNRALIRVGPR